MQLWSDSLLSYSLPPKQCTDKRKAKAERWNATAAICQHPVFKAQRYERTYNRKRIGPCPSVRQCTDCTWYFTLYSRDRFRYLASVWVFHCKGVRVYLPFFHPCLGSTWRTVSHVNNFNSSSDKIHDQKANCSWSTPVTSRFAFAGLHKLFLFRILCTERGRLSYSLNILVFIHHQDPPSDFQAQKKPPKPKKGRFPVAARQSIFSELRHWFSVSFSTNSITQFSKVHTLLGCSMITPTVKTESMLSWAECPAHGAVAHRTLTNWNGASHAPFEWQILNST